MALLSCPENPGTHTPKNAPRSSGSLRACKRFTSPDPCSLLFHLESLTGSPQHTHTHHAVSNRQPPPAPVALLRCSENPTHAYTDTQPFLEPEHMHVTLTAKGACHMRCSFWSDWVLSPQKSGYSSPSPGCLFMHSVWPSE